MSATLQTAIDNKAVNFSGYFPLGFPSDLRFQEFVVDLYSSMPTFDGTFVFQGSSVAGESFKLKAGAGSKVFDDGRVSDYDVAIVSAKLFATAQTIASIKIKDATHTEPLKGASLTALKLDTMQANADARVENYSDKKREVNFMVYSTLEAAINHTGPSLICPEPEVLRMGTSIQMYNYMSGEKKFHKKKPS